MTQYTGLTFVRAASPEDLALYEKPESNCSKYLLIITAVALAAISLTVGVTSAFYPLNALYITAGIAGGLSAVTVGVILACMARCIRLPVNSRVEDIAGIGAANFFRFIAQGELVVPGTPSNRKYLGLRNHEGQTPLMVAAKAGNLQFIELFYGAVSIRDLCKVDLSGANAVALAAEHTPWTQEGRNEVLDYLLRVPCDVAVEEAITYQEKNNKPNIANQLRRNFPPQKNRAPQAPAVTALKLYKDTFAYIGKFLDPRDLACTERVCKTWRELAYPIVENKSAWRDVAIKEGSLLTAAATRNKHQDPPGGPYRWNSLGVKLGAVPPFSFSAVFNVPSPFEERLHGSQIGPFLLPATLNGSPADLTTLSPIYHRATGAIYLGYMNDVPLAQTSWVMAMRLNLFRCNIRSAAAVKRFVSERGKGAWRIATPIEVFMLQTLMCQDQGFIDHFLLGCLEHPKKSAVGLSSIYHTHLHVFPARSQYNIIPIPTDRKLDSVIILRNV